MGSDRSDPAGLLSVAASPALQGLESEAVMLLELLTQSIGGSTVQQLSTQLGADRQSVEKGISAALPLMLGALNKNASSPQGAQSLLSALDRDHDGSILGDIGSFLNQGSTGGGEGILKHLFGNRRPAVESAVSRSSGLDVGSAGQLLTMLAPLIMGTLGQVNKQKSMDLGSLASLLQGEVSMAKDLGMAGAGLLSILDMDGDGDVMDDLGKLGGSLLGKFLGK